MKYAVDRIEEDIYVLENIETGEIVEVNSAVVPGATHEGSILKVINGQYILDVQTEKNRRKSLRERMERLKEKKSD